MDESYDNDANVFALSCLISTGKDWLELERQWKLHLSAVNKKLKKEGRSLISRYHASKCSGCKGEFKGWTKDERDAFVLGLFGIFKRVEMHTVALSVELNDICEVFPEWSDDRIKTAYFWLTRFLMCIIADDFRKMPTSKQRAVTMFHDRTAFDGKYDATILNAFNAQLSRWSASSYFTTIAPLRWEHCLPLQPADLVAFEVFKEAQARKESRDHRKSFKALLSLPTFGIHVKSLNKAVILEFRKLVDRKK
jgi:hypothetical protein